MNDETMNLHFFRKLLLKLLGLVGPGRIVAISLLLGSLSASAGDALVLVVESSGHSSSLPGSQVRDVVGSLEIGGLDSFRKDTVNASSAA